MRLLRLVWLLIILGILLNRHACKRGGKVGKRKSSQRSHARFRKTNRIGERLSQLRKVAFKRARRSSSERKRFLGQLGLKKVPRGHEVDHKKPLFAGGKDKPGNMQILSKQRALIA